MAFNLTYDPSDDPTALAESEARDQENYAIGEKLEQAQEQLLAGKYRDAEELEQAYIELQRKLGDRSSTDGAEPEEEPSEEEREVEVEDDETVDYSPITRLIEESNSGEFSQETVDAFEQMSGAEVGDMVLAYVQDNPKTEENYEMTSQDISEMKAVVGGDQQYDQMIGWAAQNMSPEEIQVFDSVIEKGDPQSIYFAVQALNYRYQDAVGYEGRMLTGNAAKSQDIYRSQAELVRDMSDPRYEKDPAYRYDVQEKVGRSNLQF
jgi:hypothetical protein